MITHNPEAAAPSKCATAAPPVNVLLDFDLCGQTILMITHNPEAAAYAHRTVKMRDGRIV
jgi:putative ABC transport system ATP-binding protein